MISKLDILIRQIGSNLHSPKHVLHERFPETKDKNNFDKSNGFGFRDILQEVIFHNNELLSPRFDFAIKMCRF